MSTRDYTPLRAEPKSCSKEDDGGGCIAGITTNGPKFYNNATIDKFDLVSIRNWIGKLPKYDSAGHPIANGTGVLGIPYLVG